MGVYKLQGEGAQSYLGLKHLWLQNRGEFKVIDWVAESRCCGDFSWDCEGLRQGSGSRDARQEIDLRTMKEI